MRGAALRNRIVFAGHGSRFVDPHSHTLVQRQADYLAERAIDAIWDGFRIGNEL